MYKTLKPPPQVLFYLKSNLHCYYLLFSRLIIIILVLLFVVYHIIFITTSYIHFETNKCAGCNLIITILFHGFFCVLLTLVVGSNS